MGITSSVQDTTAAIWAAGAYQVKAVASAWAAQPAKPIQGEHLDICLRIMQTITVDRKIRQLDMWLVRYHISFESHRGTSQPRPSSPASGQHRSGNAAPGINTPTQKCSRADPSNALYDQALCKFFAVQWGMPQLSAMEATAKATTSTTYEFHSAGNTPTPSPMRTYLERKAQHLQHTGRAREVPKPTRKADSIQDRLIAYQASIG
ncbi:hypothetical protein ON010_g5185 [Phytophthora cinnamomi]|nr:hypothetical protein ON010_g5185 [Phytophthora cinnamomi]